MTNYTENYQLVDYGIKVTLKGNRINTLSNLSMFIHNNQITSHWFVYYREFHRKKKTFDNL